MVTTFEGRVPHSTRYLDRIAASPEGQAYKREALFALNLRAGQTVMDVGCGPGTDLLALAEAVGPDGRVIGLDRAAEFVEDATERVTGTPTVEVRLGDAHRLPLDDASVDRARTDRVLQHVDSPSAALAEIRRVLRPGGIAVLSEPDWDSLATDPGDLEVNRAFNRFTCSVRVRNAIIGRELARLGIEAGLEVRDVIARSLVIRDFTLASRIYGLNRNTKRAVEAGFIDQQQAEQWTAELKEGPFLSTSIVYITVLRKPA